MFKLLTAAALLIGLTTVSYASEWNINASSCVADAGSIQGNLYIGTAGSIKWAPNKTGTITLYCPVPPLGFKPADIGITYYDDTASGTDHIVAKLVQMNISGGIAYINNAADSHSGGATNPNHAGASATTSGPLTVNWDQGSNAYYIRIDIIRTTTRPSQTVYLVSLGARD
jgi:hypothetical protein